MAKYDDLVARIEKLERKFSVLDSITQFRAGRDTKDLRELERIVDGLKRQLNGVSKQANKTEERLKDLTLNVARIDGSNDMRREDIMALREEQDGLRAENSAQARTQLDFGKRLAALEQVWWNLPGIGNETHRRIEQLVESSATDIERRLREELQSLKDLTGNNTDFLKAVQVKHGNRLDNCVAQDEDLHTRLEALSGWVERVEGRVNSHEDALETDQTSITSLEKRIEALEKAPTKVIIPDYADELGALRDRVRNLEVADAVDLQLERIRKQETHTKTPSWRAVVDSQKNVADDLKHQKLKSTLFLHLSRVYGEDSTITALARIIALVEKNRGLEAWPGHSSVFRASPLDLGIAIVNDQWQVIANIAARMLSEELAK